jgi:hypothetical protein
MYSEGNMLSRREHIMELSHLRVEKAETLEMHERWQPKLAQPRGGKRPGQTGQLDQIGSRI